MKRYFCLLPALVMILSSGCAAVLIGGAAGGGYAVATDERQSDRMMDDSTITTRINKAMVKDDVVKAHQVDVDTVGGTLR